MNRENKMISSPDVDTKLSSHYSELCHHRFDVVEGARIVSGRNLSHLNNTMQELNLADFNNSDNVAAALNKMLEDQGEKKTPANQWLIDFATWMPWETYICLLYAELEFYTKSLKLHPPLSYKPLEKYISDRGPFVDSMKKVRNTVVHATTYLNYKKNINQLHIAAQKGGENMHSEVETIQTLIDEYIEWLHPVFQNPSNKTPSPSLLQQKFDALKSSISQNPMHDPHAIQIPIHPELATFLPRPKDISSLETHNFQLSTRIKRRRNDVYELLLRSLILLNELYTNVKPTQITTQTSLFLASVALLCKPLHLYKKDSAKSKTLKHPALEKQVQEHALKSLSELRKAVFHVVKMETNLWKQQEGCLMRPAGQLITGRLSVP